MNSVLFAELPKTEQLRQDCISLNHGANKKAASTLYRGWCSATLQSYQGMPCCFACCGCLGIRDKDLESHSPRNLETCTMTWPRPGALPSPKESTMTWWICQSPKKLNIVIYLQAPEPPLSFFAGPVQPCHGISTIQRCSSKSPLGKNGLRPGNLSMAIMEDWSNQPWPPPAHQIFILFRAGSLLEEALSRCRAGYRTWHWTMKFGVRSSSQLEELKVMFSLFVYPQCLRGEGFVCAM